MIAIHTMLKQDDNEEPVEEGIGADLAHTIGKRLPFRRKVAPSGVLPSQNRTLRTAAKVMNNRSF